MYCVWGVVLLSGELFSPRRSWKGLSKVCSEQDDSESVDDGGGAVKRSSLGGGMLWMESVGLAFSDGG